MLLFEIKGKGSSTDLNFYDLIFQCLIYLVDIDIHTVYKQKHRGCELSNIKSVKRTSQSTWFTVWLKGIA